MAEPQRIERLLRDGAQRLRERYASPFIAELRNAAGLRALAAGQRPKPVARQDKPALPVFKQYREADGRFHFKLVDGERLLLQGDGFESPREAGQLVAALKAGEQALVAMADGLRLGEARIGRLGDGVGFDELQAALARFVDAE